MRDHRWPDGAAADTVLLLFGDPHYSGQSPSIEQDMVTRRMLDLRVARLAQYANEDQRQEIEDRALGLQVHKTLQERMYGMSVGHWALCKRLVARRIVGCVLKPFIRKTSDHTIPYRLMAILIGWADYATKQRSYFLTIVWVKTPIQV